jgi:hypothetical protein
VSHTRNTKGLDGLFSVFQEFSSTSALAGVGGQRHAPAALIPGKTRSHSIEGWVGHRPVWTTAENLAPTGIRSKDHPDCSEFL